MLAKILFAVEWNGASQSTSVVWCGAAARALLGVLECVREHTLYSLTRVETGEIWTKPSWTSIPSWIQKTSE
jgi:hypothetical protein